MKKILAILLLFSSFFEAFAISLLSQSQGQASAEDEEDLPSIGVVVSVLVGVGILLLLSKVASSKSSKSDKALSIPFQFIVVYRGELPRDIKPSQSLQVNGLKFSLIEWREEEQKLRQKLQKKVLILQPNYLYELLGEASPLPVRDSSPTSQRLVAVLDSGADSQRLKDILLFTKNMREDPYRAEPHGTAVAYLVHRASKAKVALYRVCSRGRCDSWSIIKALADVLRRDIKVVNMSLGTQAEDGAVKLLIKLLSAKGVRITAPVGNEPRDVVPFPARLEEVISVAGAPCFPEKVCIKAKAREPYEFELPFGTFRGTSFSSAFHAGKLVLDY